MKRFRAFFIRLWNYTRRTSTENDFRNEIESHLELHIEDNLRTGMRVEEARRQAILKLGAREAIVDVQRERRGFPSFDNVLQDLRHTMRSLRRSTGFTMVAIVTLGLSIGATTSLFSVIDATLLAPLRTPGAESLVWINEFEPSGNTSGGTPLRLADWQKLHSFENAAGFYDESLVFLDQGNIRRLDALRTFGPLGQVLHAPLTIGRLPSQREADGIEPVAILTNAAWKAVFNGDRSLVGRTIELEEKPYLVIGVLSDDVLYPEGMDVWIPAGANLQNTSRQAGFLGQVARLKPGVSLRSAQAEIDVAGTSLAKQHPATDRGRRAQIVTLHEHVTSDSRASLLTLFGAVASVFLVACLNVAGLLLARGLRRRREAEIRMALGAGRMSLIRFFVMEGFVLSVLGGAVGVGMSALGIELLKRLLPAEIPRLATAALDLRTLAFAGSVVLLSTLLCGLVPAVQLSSRLRVGNLNEGARSIGGGRERLRGVFVVAEVGASVVLLVTAGILAGSYLRMRHVPLGFHPDRAVSFAVRFPWETPSATLNSFASRAVERLEAIPGVEAAGIVDRLPLHGGSQSGPIVVNGRDLAPALASRSISWRTATPGYFAAAGIPVVAGKVFQSYQGQSGPQVVLINQRLARLMFPNANPIGREIARREGSSGPIWWRVVGVVGDVRQEPSDVEAEPEVYVPWGATYWPVMNFVVRTARPASSLASEIRTAVQPLTTKQVIEDVSPLADATDETESAPRGRAWLLTCFATVATLLAAVGVFGLLSQEVLRRTPEFGVRLALGADPRHLFWSTTRRGMRLVTAGLLSGIALSFAVTRAMQSLLSTGDPFPYASYLVASSVILLATFFACVLPGVRAASIDPMTALRCD